MTKGKRGGRTSAEVPSADPLGRLAGDDVKKGSGRFQALADAMTDGIISGAESRRFVERTQALTSLATADLAELNVTVDATELRCAARDERGVF